MGYDGGDSYGSSESSSESYSSSSESYDSSSASSSDSSYESSESSADSSMDSSSTELYSGSDVSSSSELYSGEEYSESESSGEVTEQAETEAEENVAEETGESQEELAEEDASDDSEDAENPEDSDSKEEELYEPEDSDSKQEELYDPDENGDDVDAKTRAEINEQSNYSSEVNDNIRSVEELKVYQDAGLHEEKVDGKTSLVRDDIDWNSVVDEKGRTNAERAKEGKSPINRNGEKVELHHVGQHNDSPLAELTFKEHRSKANDSILHDKSKPSEIDRETFENKERVNHWKHRI